MIVLIGAAVYANSLSGPFTFDDQSAIVDNTRIQHLWPLSDALSPPGHGAPVAGRPLVNLSLALNYAVGGLDVRGYHIVNLGLHLLCALILFALLRSALRLPRLAGSFSEHEAVGVAFVCALIWTVHPLQTETVDYISARTESMMGLCYLLTFYMSIRAASSHRPRRWLMAAMLACAMGMACKETMATAPLIVMLFDRIFVFDSFKQALRTRGRFYLGLAATWIVLVGLLWSGPRWESAGFFTGITPWTYLLNQAGMVVRYLELAFWPRALILDYGEPQRITLAAAAPYAAFVVALLLITAVALVRRPMWGFLGAWFFVILAPTSSVIPIATEVGAERRLYLPLAAIVVLVVIAWHAVWRHLIRDADQLRPIRRLQSIAGAVAALLVCGPLAVATVRRNSDYQSGITLWRTVLERRPHARAHHNLAVALKAAGYRDEVVAEMRAAVREKPDSRYELGYELLQQGRVREASDELERFIRENPADPEVTSARGLLTLALAPQGRPAEVLEQWRLIHQARPADLGAEESLADALLAQRQFDEARVYYVELLKSKPDNAGAWKNLGIALGAINRLDEATAAFRRAAELDPEDERAQVGLAGMLLQQHDYDAAMKPAEEALRLNPRNVAAHNMLGLALANRLKFDEAISQFQAALAIDPASAEARDYLARTRKLKKMP